MSSYQPPQENLPIFDAGVFLNESGVLTVDYLATLFVRYPIAQSGLLTLSSTLTEGTAAFNSPITLNDPPALGANNALVPTTAWVNTAIAGGGGSLLPLNNTWTGTNTFTLGTNMNITAAGNPIQALSMTDLTSSDYMYFLPNSTSGAYNAIVQPGDSEIVVGGSAISTQSLTLTSWSATKTGVRITPTSALIGAGGGSGGYDPTSSLLCQGSTATLTGALSITGQPSTTVAQPAFTDSTTKIPTTAWVQGAITSGFVPQAWSWSGFNITASGFGGIRTATINLPYPNATTYSTTIRLEFNYQIFANSINSATGSPVPLSGIVPTSGTNVNPNTYSIIDLVLNSSTTQMIPYVTQSTFANVIGSSGNNVYTIGTSGYGYVPISFSRTIAGSIIQILCAVNIPNSPYSAANYIGNIMAFSTSLRILSSQTSVTNTPTTTNFSSGVAYFV